MSLKAMFKRLCKQSFKSVGCRYSNTTKETHTNVFKLPSIYNDFLRVSAATCLAEHVGVRRIKKVNQSHYRPEAPKGFQEVDVPTFRDNGTGWW